MHGCLWALDLLGRNERGSPAPTLVDCAARRIGFFLGAVSLTESQPPHSATGPTGHIPTLTGGTGAATEPGGE